tara:strand:- start:22144 stop:22668 length:525 start_codon:yes stop_codon:yes gene_type:complete
MRFANYIHTALISSIFFLALSCGKAKERNNVVFVHNQKVIDNFQMTKDLMRGLEEEKEILIKERKSIEEQLKKLSRDLSNQNIDSEEQSRRLQSAYNVSAQKIQEIDDNLFRLESQVQTQVTKRLDGYIKSFAEEKQIDFIMGANGSGSLLYGNPESDITEELITYANNKYEGH